MKKSVSKQSDVVCLVPTQVTLLGEALKPVAAKLHENLAQNEWATGPEFDTLTDLGLHMGVIGKALTHLESKLDDLMQSVIQNDRATALDVGRAVGRLEQVLSEFANGYQEVMTSAPGLTSAEARELLLGVYQHHISELSQWLDKLVSAIAEPLAALEGQHIRLAKNVVLPVTLNLTSPPQMIRLNEIAQELHCGSPNQAPTSDQPTKPGLLATIGALAFGLGVANEAWGKKQD